MAACRAVLLAAALASATAADAAQVVVDTHRRGEAVDIVATADIAAAPGPAWSVLTDYERYPRFIPDLAASRVVARRGSRLVLEQEGAVRLWWWRVPLKVTLAVVESPPREVRSHLVEGSVRRMDGRYELEPGPLGVRLTYTGTIVPGEDRVGLLDRIAIRDGISRQFRALAEEIERRGGAAVPAGAGGG